MFAAYGFDTSSQVTNYYVPSGAGNGTLGFFDTTTACMPGGGSLRFDLPAGKTGADISGSWYFQSAPYAFNGSSFGQNSTFYFQYRYRWTASMITNLSSWNSFPKASILMMNTASCANMELTIVDYFGNGPIMYTNCGSRHMFTTTSGPTYTESTPLLVQSGWDLSTGPSYTNEPNAIVNQYPSYWQYPTDEWLTIYGKVHIGTLTSGGGTQDSTIELWVKRDANNYWQKFCSVFMGLEYNTNSSDVYNNIMLTPYMTGLSTSAPANASIWYDELIFSTQPIALPAQSNT